MKNNLKNYIIEQWPRKLISLCIAMFLWWAINTSLVTTKTIVGVKVYLEHIPNEKTMLGLDDQRKLKNTVTLTITGSKSVIDTLDSQNTKIIIDAKGKGDSWAEKITKQQIHCSELEGNISRYIQRIDPIQIDVKLTRLITEQIPINVVKAKGHSPDGFEFVGVWPPKLYQSITGPEEEIYEIRKKGLALILDLGLVPPEELEILATNSDSDEIRFPVPAKWQRVHLPVLTKKSIQLNDPRAGQLSLDFLKKELLPLNQSVPVRLFFSTKTSEQYNPNNCKLMPSEDIRCENGMMLLAIPLYVKDVSQAFLDIVSNQMEIVIHVTPGEEDNLYWDLDFINPEKLEQLYVLSQEPPYEEEAIEKQLREAHCRTRFNHYMKKCRLADSQNDDLHLHFFIENSQIKLVR